jgi:hypothetical protein
MKTIFSHIVQKRFSQENENIATDALAYILDSHESARNGLMKLLRGIAPDMPELQYQSQTQAQQEEGSIRPDMWGFDNSDTHVFIENKFWAGLTENQPIAYLNELAKFSAPTVLLFVVPASREQTIIRELGRRLNEAGISVKDDETHSKSVLSSVTTGLGPILAITSWTRLFSFLDFEVAIDPNAKSDLFQLRALCESAELDVFSPISSKEKTDQRIPGYMLQLGIIVQDSVQKAVNQNILSIKGLNPQADWSRIGRYAKFTGENGIGFWIGIHFGKWKEQGQTPLWMILRNAEWSTNRRLHEVRTKLEPLVNKEGIYITTIQDEEMAVAIEITSGEEKDRVVNGVVEQLKKVSEALSIPTGN